jgi:hypothetical protein
MWHKEMAPSAGYNVDPPGAALMMLVNLTGIEPCAPVQPRGTRAWRLVQSLEEMIFGARIVALHNPK